ncbi:MAG: sodium:alanine symporter family protein [Myxococcales bacterium]|nr:sodium:alanine symporter family protein [Myxococcales bacterium]
MNEFLTAVNAVIWSDFVLYAVLATGVLFTIWSGFCQYHALSHGTAVTLGRYDESDDPGAINHFQALSAALSATVGLGNIGGVAVAIALGGPGAMFWMWVVGLVGMALKTTEVTQAMLFRNTDDRDNPHGGPMWVVDQGIREHFPTFKALARPLGILFCITLLIATITGGNMFQAWNVGVVTSKALPDLPVQLVGVVLAVLVGLTILGGIKRIGAVAGRVVPFMCVLYLIAATYVLLVNAERLPDTLRLIFTSAFSPSEADNAFLGGTFGLAFLWGMKRALFSSEAGQGSSPIAHSAAKTHEPVREGVVAGLEPFIDTLVVATLTSLVILSSGAWNREGEATLAEVPSFVAAAEDGAWTLPKTELPAKHDDAERVSGPWAAKDNVFLVARYGPVDEETGDNVHRVTGVVAQEGGKLVVTWEAVGAADDPIAEAPLVEHPTVYRDYPGAALTSYAFDLALPGLGTWLVMIASWLFAVSTMISWSYYGEQGVVYIAGERAVLPYKVIYCAFILAACSGYITTDSDLDNLTALGTGVMLWVNIPIMLLFGAIAMRAYKDYFKRLRAGQLKPTKR